MFRRGTSIFKELKKLIRLEGGGPTTEHFFLGMFELEFKRFLLGHSISQEKHMMMPSGTLRRVIIMTCDLFQHLHGPFQSFDLRRFQVSVHSFQLLESLTTEGVCDELS